jgi:hypothetical protein
VFILTPEQDAAMRRGVQGLPERTVVPTNYPAARLSRRRQAPGVQLPGGAVDLGSLPQDFGSKAGVPHLWPIYLQSTAGPERSVVVSPRYSGPGLVDSAILTVAITGASVMSGFQLYYSDDGSGQGNTLAITPPPSGTPMFDPASVATDGGQTIRDPFGPGFTQTIAQTSLVVLQLGVRVPLNDFFLKASLISQGADTNTIQGWIRLVTQLPEYTEVA